MNPASSESDAAKSATVTFSKETAAKTALLLDNTQLGPAQVHVTSAASLDDLAGKPSGEGEHEGDDVTQEDKPRTRIIAEYLANGYHISDQAIERAITLDNKHGISNRFVATLRQFDEKYHATEKAESIDKKYGISERAMATWRGLNSYFEKAMHTPSGRKLRDFYEQGNKTVMDVHNEARHLADLKTGKSQPHQVPGEPNRTQCDCVAKTGKCGCAPGKCACANCAKNADAEQSGMRKVEGTERTKCNCGADTGACPCEPGKCACENCAKNPEAKSSASAEEMNMHKIGDGERTQCDCGGGAGRCPCEPGKCACASCGKNPEVAGKA